MNGADNLLDTLIAGGVEVCFANPGTSEMQLVSAIGNRDGMRAILCLFEGVASGAADGYARMTDTPALTLLHLGSGFANSMANQHNAMRAHVPLINLVGDHATWHQQYDAPLTSDVAAHAAIPSDWVRVSESPDDLAQAGAEAIQAAQTGAGGIATVIVPANHAWEDAKVAAEPLPVPRRTRVPEASIARAAAVLKSARTPALFLGGRALREPGLDAAGRIARATGARLLCETFSARLQRGVGRVAVERLPYFAEEALQALAGLDRIVFIGARPPVSFFAYPGKPSWLTPEDCETLELATVDEDVEQALLDLADALSAHEPANVVAPAPEPEVETPAATQHGPLTPLALGQSLSALLPENAIVTDEAATCGMALYPLTTQAAAHDWLSLTGGAIGIGLPLALGASVACPERKVVALQADGSAMYTVQALWTMAREQTDVTVVIMNNRSYAILNIELARVGAGTPTPKTLSMLDLSRPDIDWVEIARGMGVPATRATTPAEFHEQFEAAVARPGPALIDAVVTQELPG
ncbi:acetolactate synthase large subunit [Elongatibacter sediminis]|uniref:Acetolactate synthase large subunit n=1 Tax=Elongatibacter sediminis TaxID=3119006 RepID=A0AAW9RCM9_9GAMM